MLEVRLSAEAWPLGPSPRRSRRAERPWRPCPRRWLGTTALGDRACDRRSTRSGLPGCSDIDGAGTERHVPDQAQADRGHGRRRSFSRHGCRGNRRGGEGKKHSANRCQTTGASVSSKTSSPPADEIRQRARELIYFFRNNHIFPEMNSGRKRFASLRRSAKRPCPS